MDPSGQFAYVANNGSNDISVYTIDPTSGALTAVGTAVAAGTSPLSVATTNAGVLTTLTTGTDTSPPVITSLLFSAFHLVFHAPL